MLSELCQLVCQILAVGLWQEPHPMHNDTDEPPLPSSWWIGAVWVAQVGTALAVLVTTVGPLWETTV